MDDEERQQLEYLRLLYELETGGEKTTIVIGPFSAITIIGLVQLATRHPDMDPRTKEVARAYARQFEPLFAGTPGEEIIRRGFHPEFDR